MDKLFARLGITIAARRHSVSHPQTLNKCIQVQSTIDHITNAHSKLLRLSGDLRPGDVINEVLTNLVALCCDIQDNQTIELILADRRVKPILPCLRAICGQAECCLEMHWANYIAGSDDHDEARERMRSFPYYQNYEDLTRMELCALSSVNSVLPTKVTFIGSGPLPLTSLFLLQILKQARPAPSTCFSPENKDIVVLNIDRDSDATAASSALCAKLGDQALGMEFNCAEAGSATQDLIDFDVVYLAALVGNSQSEKEEILIDVAVKMRAGALMVVRTSWGLRTCLYPEIDLDTDRLAR